MILQAVIGRGQAGAKGVKMPTDLEIIQQLAKDLGLALEEREKIGPFKAAGYQMDGQQNVTNLSLHHLGLMEPPEPSPSCHSWQC